MSCLRSWLGAMCLLAACGSTAPSLSRAERERLPLDGRQEIFDAENDLIIARNRADLAADHLRSLDETIAGLDDVETRYERPARCQFHRVPADASSAQGRPRRARLPGRPS